MPMRWGHEMLAGSATQANSLVKVSLLLRENAHDCVRCNYSAGALAVKVNNRDRIEDPLTTTQPLAVLRIVESNSCEITQLWQQGCEVLRIGKCFMEGLPN